MSVKKSHSDKEWEAMFQRLLEFRFMNGHWLVPDPCQSDPKLGGWVAKQRRQYWDIQSGKSSRALTSLSVEREKKMSQVGFVWKMQTAGQVNPNDGKESKTDRKQGKLKPYECTSSNSYVALKTTGAINPNIMGQVPGKNASPLILNPQARRKEPIELSKNSTPVNLPVLVKDDAFMSNWVRNKCFHSLFKKRQHRLLMECVSAQLRWNPLHLQTPPRPPPTSQAYNYKDTTVSSDKKRNFAETVAPSSGTPETTTKVVTTKVVEKEQEKKPNNGDKQKEQSDNVSKQVKEPRLKASSTLQNLPVKKRLRIDPALRAQTQIKN